MKSSMLFGLFLIGVLPAATSGQVVFERDVRPLLSDRCFKCHGPDEATREAGLRLDTPEGMSMDLGRGRRAVVPGDPASSVLMERLRTHDPLDRMPPPDAGLDLTETEIQLIEDWIREDGVYRRHWSFVPPVRQEIPEVESDEACENDIDRFILARLEQEGIEPSEEADRETLIRRLAFDLTGLPPSPEEIDEFVSDTRPDAYERLVDRMLENPHYGERMAMTWLDVARYADSHGYHHDDARVMWPWRDWVIQAFNENKPYDRFIIEQLAGDLLDDPTLEQRVATGFNRNHPITFEGGVISEEYRVEYVADRVTTTSTAFLALTMECARCHEHKYDPISHEEYFGFYAFFNSTDEQGLDRRGPSTNPMLRVPTPDVQDRLDEIDQRLAEADAALEEALAPTREAASAEFADVRRLVEWETFEPTSVRSTNGATVDVDGATFTVSREGAPSFDVFEVEATTDETGLRIVRLDALLDDQGRLGLAPNANVVLSGLDLEVIASDGRTEEVRFTHAWADYEQENGDYVARNVLASDQKNGWALGAHMRPGQRTAMFIAERPFGFEGGSTLRFRVRFESVYALHTASRMRLHVATGGESESILLRAAPDPVEFSTWRMSPAYKASNGNEAFRTAFAPETDPDSVTWTEKPEYTDGVAHPLSGENSAFYLRRTITSPDHRRLRLGLGSDDALKLWINGVEVASANTRRAVGVDQNVVEVRLTPGENDVLFKIVNEGGPGGFSFKATDLHNDTLDHLLPLAMIDDRDEHQEARLVDAWRLERVPAYAEHRALVETIEAERTEAVSSAPVMMVMGDLPMPRPTYRLQRGAYDNPDTSKTIEPRIPAALGSLPEGAPANRLGLAMWMVDDENPLVARVAVNRFWQMFFGTGLVKTTEDFGSQTEWPSHPALLDHLAVEFREHNWDVHWLIRQIVTSAAYRRSSAIRTDLATRDPENRLLARGSRFRLTAEMVRDNALAASGLLVTDIGGPSVKPYQPAGLWIERAIPGSLLKNFVRDEGDRLYRRGMYTFWKRSAPPPQLMTFDAPEREYCVVRRASTNTPLQALVLMNDETYLEAARVLAQRVMHERDEPDARLERAWRLATGRVPTEDELRTLLGFLNDSMVRFAQAPDDARAMLRYGEAPGIEADPVEVASYMVAASVILNLSETITRD